MQRSQETSNCPDLPWHATDTQQFTGNVNTKTYSATRLTVAIQQTFFLQVSNKMQNNMFSIIRCCVTVNSVTSPIF